DGARRSARPPIRRHDRRRSRWLVPARSPPTMPPSKRRAFTLIELLVVVAVIASLAAIALPNFLEAQVRAKVSRSKNDLRVLGSASMQYYLDNNQFPPDNFPGQALDIQSLYFLTTPIAFL